MAITATDRGTGSNNSSGTSFNVAGALTGGGMAAGSTGILMISMDNGNGASSNFTAATTTGKYTDSKGNDWYMQAQAVSGTAYAGVEAALLTSLLTSSLTSSDTLTITLTTAPSTISKSWAFVEAAPTAGNIVIYHAGSITTAGSGTTQSVASFAPSNGDLLVAFTAAENDDSTNPFTADSDTLNGSWSTAQHTGVNTGTVSTSNSISSQWKLATAYGTQTYNLSTTSTCDYRQGQTMLSEADDKIRVLGGNVSSETSTTITIWKALAANSIGVLCIASDNSFTGGASGLYPSTINDLRSNTWTLRADWVYDPVGTNVGAEIGVYTCVLTTGLQIGDTITLGAYNGGVSVPAKMFALWEFAPTGAGSMSYVTGAQGTASNTTSPTVTTSSIANGDYVIGLMGAEGSASGEDNITQTSDTTNGVWKKQASVTRGSGATAMAVATQWKKVTSAGAQTYNPTQGAANDCTIGWIQVNDSSPTGGLTAAQKAAFFQMF